MDAMKTGVVAFFDQKGYGFIAQANGDEDIYFHASALPGARGKRFIADGQRVHYEVGTRFGQQVAKLVVPVEDEEKPTSEIPEVGNGRKE